MSSTDAGVVCDRVSMHGPNWTFRKLPSLLCLKMAREQLATGGAGNGTNTVLTIEHSIMHGKADEAPHAGHVLHTRSESFVLHKQGPLRDDLRKRAPVGDSSAEKRPIVRAGRIRNRPKTERERNMHQEE